MSDIEANYPIFYLKHISVVERVTTVEDTYNVITTQWPKEKRQKEDQRSTKHRDKTKDRATGTPLKTGEKVRCTGRVSCSCSTCGTRGVTLCTISVISDE